MYTGFNLCIKKEELICKIVHERYKYYVEKGERHLEKQRTSCEAHLKNYINGNQINGSKIQNEWFPQVEADVFISHSHNDIELACALAGWLYEKFRLKCFIDYNVWGYSDELLENMNDKLSDKTDNGNGGWLYDHKSCIEVSKHVDTMLSIALQKMIDKVEAVILLNTENSVQVYNDISMAETYSPWIYSEIICTEIVRKKPLLVYRDYPAGEDWGLYESMQPRLMFKLSYEVSLKHLIALKVDDLSKWEKEYNSEHYQYALDALYKFKCRNEVKRTQELFSTLGKEKVYELKKRYSGNDIEGQRDTYSESVEWDEIPCCLKECFNCKCKYNCWRE